MRAIADYFWRLVPANPILLRVVESAGKRRRDLLIRAGYLALLIGVVAVSLLGTGALGEADLSKLSKTSASLFESMSYMQLALVALLAPIFTAGAITQEKDGQTYDILLTTPLSNAQILLGSLLSRLFFVIALLLSGIPIFAITQIFGGVAIGAIAMSFAIAAATAWVTACLAIAIATFKVGSRRTILGFYLFIAAYLVIGWMLDGVDALHFRDRTTGALSGTSWITGLHPFLALKAIFHSPEYLPPDAGSLPPNLRTWPIGWWLTNPAGFYVALMFALGAVLVAPSIVLLRRVAQATLSVRAWVWTKIRLGRPIRGRRPRVVWNNPIAWREARTKASATRATLVRWTFLLVGLGAAITLVAMWSQRLQPTARVTAVAWDSGPRELTIVADNLPTAYRLTDATLITYQGWPTDTSIFGADMAVVSYNLVAPGARILAAVDLGPIPRRLSDERARSMLLGLSIVELTAILLIVTNAAASTVTREKEDGTLDMLLATPITSRFYLWGKLTGLIGFAAPLLAVAWAGVAMFVVADVIAGDPRGRWIVHPEAVIVLPGMLVATTAFAAMVGMTMSLRFRRSVTAVMASVAIVLGACFTLGWCGTGALDTLRGAPDFAAAVAAFSPYTLLMVLIDPVRFGGRVLNPADPDAIARARLVLLIFSFIGSGLYAMVVWAMYKSMVKNFDMTIRRQAR